MKVKRLFFESVKDGIKRIKEEYGPDAIIIDIKENGDAARKGYEILIAMDEESNVRHEGSVSGDVMKKIDEISTCVKALSEKVGAIESDTMRHRIEGYPDTLRDFYNRMLKNGLEAKLAFSIISEVYAETGKFAEDNNKAGFFLKRILAKRIQVSALSDSDEPIMILGPSGAGKTDTTKKLARRFMDSNRPVSIIAHDPVRKDRYNEYMIFSENTGIPFFFTANSDDLPFMMERDRRRKIVDISGSLSVQKKAVEQLKGANKIILFPAWTRDDKMKEYCGEFQEADYSGLIFTKLDEEGHLGHICDYLMNMDKPVYFLTTGAGVKDIIVPDQDTFYTILLEENTWRSEERRP